MPESRILAFAYNALREAGEDQMHLARFGLIAVCIVATMAVIALIGTAFFIQHHRSERASAQTADAEFQRLRARFADQRPLVDMQERRSVSDVGGPQPGAP